MKRSYLIDTEDFTAVMKDIKAMQNKANSVTDESADREIKTALTQHVNAMGKIECLSGLKLLTGNEYSDLMQQQHRTGEKLCDLQKRRRRE